MVSGREIGTLFGAFYQEKALVRAFSVIVKTSPEVRCVLCSPHHHHHRALSGRLFNPNIFQSEIFGDYAFYQLFLEEDKRMITVIAAIMGKYIRLHYLMPGSLARRYCSGKNDANGMSKGDAQKWGR